MLGSNAKYDGSTSTRSMTNIGGTGEYAIDDAIRSANDAANAGWNVANANGKSHNIGPDGKVTFNGSGNIKPDGMKQLDTLASDIMKNIDNVGSIRVVGYTDRLGSDAYNDSLSTKRAYTVMRYLIGKGVPGPSIQAVGLGKAGPVQTGCADQSREALIACLAPNRRVEVRVAGNK